MKSTNAILAALASTAVAQPHGYQHAHLHPGRMEHQHQHDKRVLATETVVEWVTETVVEMVDATTTEWVTEGASTTTQTTLSTVIAATTSQDGEFFETASSSSQTTTSATTPVAVAQPVEPTTTTPATTATASPTPEPEPEPTTTTSAYVAPVEPTTTSATTTSEATTAAAATTTAVATASIGSGSGSGSVSGTSFSGKLTWIGDTTGAYSACGQPYEADSMFVAVNPSVLDCGSDGMGSPMTITANGKTVSAVAIDKCMGCDTTHIDVASAVWTALGYTFTDGGMHDNAGLSWVLSATK